MSEDNPFRLEAEGYIRWLILDRADSLNSMTEDFFSGLRKIFPELSEDPGVRVVIIRAEGKGFTAGFNLPYAKSLFGGTAADSREGFRKKIFEGQESMNVIERCQKPVIAAVHGACIGAGLDLICACDVRLASADSIFSIRETRLGIVPDLGTLQRMSNIVGEGWFRELALTGIDFTAKEALRIGLITHLCEGREQLYAEAKEIAERMAANSPLTVQGVKDVIVHTRYNGMRAGLEYVAQKNAALVPSEDLTEAIRAFKEKRTPEFKGK